MASPKRRIETDVMKLLMSDYKVNLVEDNMQEFYVCFEGPKDTPYEGGLWRIHVELPDQYPYKSPSIGFHNKIYHPNIDETSGSVCLDVINQTWSPMFTVFNIFDTFIPQLLNYPNAADPLNSNASTLYMRNKAKYNETVEFYVKKYANPEVVKKEFEDYEDDEEKSGKNEEEDENEDDDLSSVDGSDEEKKYIKTEKKDKELDRNGNADDIEDDDEEEVNDEEEVDDETEEEDDDDLMDL